jgi:hypothetical protein
MLVLWAAHLHLGLVSIIIGLDIIAALSPPPLSLCSLNLAIW